jgi:hypothetical protein
VSLPVALLHSLLLATLWPISKTILAPTAAIMDVLRASDVMLLQLIHSCISRTSLPAQDDFQPTSGTVSSMTLAHKTIKQVHRCVDKAPLSRQGMQHQHIQKAVGPCNPRHPCCPLSRPFLPCG